MLRSKRDFFIFLSKYYSHSKTASEKPIKFIFDEFARFIIRNNFILNSVIIFFSCSLGGRPNSCFDNWTHESQFLFFFYCSPFVLFFGKSPNVVSPSKHIRFMGKVSNRHKRQVPFMAITIVYYYWPFSRPCKAGDIS